MGIQQPQQYVFYGHDVLTSIVLSTQGLCMPVHAKSGILPPQQENLNSNYLI